MIPIDVRVICATNRNLDEMVRVRQRQIGAVEPQIACEHASRGARAYHCYWMRTILDEFAMAVYFNLFAAAVALYKPRLMFPCYPPAIIKAAEEPPTKAENRFYWL